MVQIVQLKPGEAHLRPDHFRGDISAIVLAVAETAPSMVDETLWITSAWRPPSGEPSYHPVCRALDFRVRNILAASLDEREELAQLWVERIRDRLPFPQYDVILHGEGLNRHIHVERNADTPI